MLEGERNPAEGAGEAAGVGAGEKVGNGATGVSARCAADAAKVGLGEASDVSLARPDASLAPPDVSLASPEAGLRGGPLDALLPA